MSELKFTNVWDYIYIQMEIMMKLYNCYRHFLLIV